MGYDLKTRIVKRLGNIMKRKLFLIFLLLLLLAIGYPIQSAANEFIITIDTSKQKLFVFEGREIIRMKNQDIFELFDLVPEGTLVGIHE